MGLATKYQLINSKTISCLINEKELLLWKTSKNHFFYYQSQKEAGTLYRGFNRVGFLNGKQNKKELRECWLADQLKYWHDPRNFADHSSLCFYPLHNPQIHLPFVVEWQIWFVSYHKPSSFYLWHRLKRVILFLFFFFFFNQLNVVLIWKKKFFKESVLFRICGHFSCWYVKYGTYIFLQLLNLDSDGTSEVCCCLEKKERKHQNQIVCDIWLWISFVSVNIVNKAACTLHY